MTDFGRPVPAGLEVISEAPVGLEPRADADRVIGGHADLGGDDLDHVLG